MWIYMCVCVYEWAVHKRVEVIGQLCRVGSLLRLKLRRLGFVAAPSSVRSPSHRLDILPDVPSTRPGCPRFSPFLRMSLLIDRRKLSGLSWRSAGMKPWKKLGFQICTLWIHCQRDAYMCTKRGTLPQAQLSSSVVFLWISTSLLFAFQNNWEHQKG